MANAEIAHMAIVISSTGAAKISKQLNNGVLCHSGQSSGRSDGATLHVKKMSANLYNFL